jgi:hypothetical protein
MTFTLFERVLIDSLMKPKSLVQLSSELKTSKEILISILQSLIIKDFILCDKRVYFLNPNKIEELKKIISTSEYRFTQKYEVFDHCIQNKMINNKDDSFELLTAYLTESEEKILHGHLRNLRDFFVTKKASSHLDKKVVFFGVTNYSDLLATSSPN